MTSSTTRVARSAQNRSSDTARTHTVRSGESLWSIAKKHSGATKNAEISRYHQDLIRANPQIKDPNVIRPGQQLRLPESRATNGDVAATQTGADGRATYQPAGTAPPPQTARPDPSASNHPPISADPAFDSEISARRTAVSTAHGGSARRANEESTGTTRRTANEPAPGSISGRPSGGGVVVPNPNLSGSRIRHQRDVGVDVRSGTRRDHRETEVLRNRGAEQTRDTNSETTERTRNGQRTTQLQEENRIRDRLTGASETERTTVAGDQDGRTGSRTTNESVDADGDGRTLRERLMEENGGRPNVAVTGVLFDQRIAGDDNYRGVATVDRRHTGDGTGAGYEAHALAYRANANAAGTVDLRNAEVNVGVNASVNADLVGVSGRAQVGTRDSIRGQAFAEGDARIGARAEGSAGVVIDRNNVGVRVGGEAFAGAEIRGTVGAENRYGGVSVTGRGQAGAGAAAGLDVGYRNGRVGVHADLGAALGLGARVTVDVNVNVRAIGEDAVAGARTLGRRVATETRSTRRAIGNTVNDVADGARDLARDARRTASRAWSSINPFD